MHYFKNKMALQIVAFRVIPRSIDVVRANCLWSGQTEFVDWTFETLPTCQELTNKLCSQISYEVGFENTLRGACNSASVEHEEEESVEDDDIEEPIYKFGQEITYGGITYNGPNFTKELCERYERALRGLRDIHDKDVDALGKKWKLPPYAVVLLRGNQYYGHIYAWTATQNCFAIGIRARSDSLILRGTARELRNVSHYLLDGVRRFALSKGCTTVTVVSPLEVMMPILRGLGFRYNLNLSVPRGGMHMGTPFTYSNVDQPLVSGPIEFSSFDCN